MRAAGDWRVRAQRLATAYGLLLEFRSLWCDATQGLAALVVIRLTTQNHLLESVRRCMSWYGCHESP